MPTRSTALVAQQCAAGALTTLATVPVGETWIVKSYALLAVSGLLTRPSLYVERTAVNALGIIFTGQIDAGSYRYGECWVVAEPGDKLQLFVAGDSMNVWLSGAALPGVAP